MRLTLLLVALVLMATACSNPPGETDEAAATDLIYGTWTPVSVDDCEAVVVTIAQGVFGVVVNDQPPFSIGETTHVESLEPGFVDVIYHPTIYGADGRPSGAVTYTETVRFEVLGDDRLRAIGHIPRDAAALESMPEESAYVLDIKRCGASTATSSTRSP